MRKAQFEFVAIAGIIFIAAIVIALTYQAVTAPLPSPVPSAIAEEQKTLKASMEILAKNGAEEVIRIAERQGGYMTPQVLREDFNVRPFAFFMKNGVAYWQKCGTSYYPSVEQLQESLETGMYEYLLRTLEGNGTVGGKRVELSLKAMTVDARILDQKVDFTIDLPTRIENYTLREKYTVSVPTDFGRIYKFASALSDELAENRAFDIFTISSLWLSKSLPTIGMMNECGEAIVMTPDEVSAGLEAAARHVVTSTALWEPMNADDGIKYYSIETVKGQRFQDLDISFWLADDFEVTTYDPIVIVNSDINIKSEMAVVPYCIKPYANYYSLTYPIVVNVKDRQLGTDFNFAVLVNVDSMKPGECTLTGRRPECGEQGCTAKVDVVDGWGVPVEGATVSFGGCYYAKTDAFGEGGAQIDCGPENITVTKGGRYFPFSGEVAEEDINGTYVLHNIPDIEINLYTVNLTTRNGFEYCDVKKVENESVIILMTSEALNATADNKDEDFDVGACIEEDAEDNPCRLEGITEYDEERINQLFEAIISLETADFDVRNSLREALYDEIEAEMSKGRDPTECLRSIDMCVKGNLLDKTVVSYAPGGYEYTLKTLVTNPQLSVRYPIPGQDFVEVRVDVDLLRSEDHTRYLTDRDYMFLDIPLITHEDTIMIPEDNSRINLYIPETSHLLERAAEIYKDRYRHYLQGGSEPWHIIKTETCSALDENCARGMALQYVLAWLNEYSFKADLDKCSLRMVEYAA